MNGRRPTSRRGGGHPGAGVRPFGPGEAPLGVRPGLAGGRRRAGVTPLGGAAGHRSTEPAGLGQGRESRRSLIGGGRLNKIAVGALLISALFAPPLAARANVAQVRHIDVSGTNLLDPSAVVEISNIALGSSLLGADLRAAERSVASLPLVESVRISAGLPDGLQIRVREKALLLRWKIGERVYGISDSGELLGDLDTLNLASAAEARWMGTPLVIDERPASPLLTDGRLSAIDFDVATRLASLVPADLGTAATSINLKLTSDFGFVIAADSPTVTWVAVFGIYSATIRPTSMIPGQVRLLRSLLAGRETRIGWVILADDQAGTYTDKGVRPPSPSANPSPTPSPTDPTPSPTVPAGSP